MGFAEESVMGCKGTTFTLLALLVACQSTQENKSNPAAAGGKSGANQVNSDGGTDSTAGGAQAIGTGGAAVFTGGTAGTTDVAIVNGGIAGTTFIVVHTGGVAGQSGINTCPMADGVCSAPCISVPIARGCGDVLQRETLCMEAAIPVTAPACGVHIATGALYRLDVTRPPPIEGWQRDINPFSMVTGYRACVQSEVDATNCWPAAQESAQTVTFQVTNESTVIRKLATSGMSCSAFGIERVEDSSALLLGVDGVMCPPCPMASVSCDPGRRTTFTELAPGDTYALSWDARERLLVEHIVACPNSNVQVHDPVGIPMRSAPGQYRAQIGVGYLGAAGAGPGSDYIYPHFPEVHPVCRSAEQISVEFTLPPTGNVVVPVSIR
jgi:hypothetical protein